MLTNVSCSSLYLWIDEIEKAFFGVGGQNNDIVKRMFGYLLEWLQDKKSSVYVIATANNANNYPPGLKRKVGFSKLVESNKLNEDLIISAEMLLTEAKSTVSISKSCKEQIEKMKKVFQSSNFKDASKV